MALQEELLELEHGFWDAAGDGDRYRRHMADDGLLLIPFGILDKEATVAAVEEAEPWSSHEMEDLAVLVHGEAAVTLCYRAEADRHGAVFRAAVSSTYRRQGEHWLLVVHQQTPLQ